MIRPRVTPSSTYDEAGMGRDGPGGDNEPAGPGSVSGPNAGQTVGECVGV